MAGRMTVHYEDTGHTGWDVTRYIHRLLMIDEPWTTWHDDGFTWWAHGLAQRYRWEGPTTIDDLPTWFVSVETDFLRDATPRERALESVNDLNATLALGTGALELDGDRIRLRARAYALPESGHERARWIATVGLVSVNLATRLADVHERDRSALAEFGIDPAWTADASGHPRSGPRPQPDEMLNVVNAVYRREGERPARETVDLALDETVHSLMRTGTATVGGDATGGLLATWASPAGQVEWRLERAHHHDVLGYGARSRITIRPTDVPVTPELANRLNALEATAAFPLIGGGAWAAARDRDATVLLHSTFLPNAALQGQLGPALLGMVRFRVRWVGGVLEGEAGASPRTGTRSDPTAASLRNMVPPVVPSSEA
jgi:hypothetical protein